MSFQPLSEGLSSSLLGVADPVKFVDPVRYEGRIHAPFPSEPTIKYTLLIIIISAIIFVTALSVYDVVRNLINNYFAKQALLNPVSNNTKEDIDRTLIANRGGLISSSIFSVFCIILAIILIPILISLIKN